MKRSKYLALAVTVAALAISVTAAGCSSTSGGAATSATPQQVDDASQLAMIRAHQLVALRLYEIGQGEKAVKHAGHPAEEIFFSLSRSMRSQNAALTADLETSLRASKDLLLRGAPVAEVKTSFERGWGVLETAEAALVPDDVRNTSAFRGAVVSSLLGGVKGEYAEAVVGGELEMEIEYQDAWGALEVATERFTTARSDFGQMAAEISEHLDVLRGYLPGVTPPTPVAAAEQVNEEVTSVQGDIQRAT